MSKNVNRNRGSIVVQLPRMQGIGAQQLIFTERWPRMVELRHFGTEENLQKLSDDTILICAQWFTRAAIAILDDIEDLSAPKAKNPKAKSPS